MPENLSFDTCHVGTQIRFKEALSISPNSYKCWQHREGFFTTFRAVAKDCYYFAATNFGAFCNAAVKPCEHE